MVVNQPKIDVNTELARSDTGSVDGEQAVSDTSDTSENTISADRLSELESLASKYAASEDRDLVEEVSSGAYFDKHTKLYVPVRLGKGQCGLSFSCTVVYGSMASVMAPPRGDGVREQYDGLIGGSRLIHSYSFQAIGATPQSRQAILTALYGDTALMGDSYCTIVFCERCSYATLYRYTKRYLPVEGKDECELSFSYI